MVPQGGTTESCVQAMHGFAHTCAFKVVLLLALEGLATYLATQHTQLCSHGVCRAKQDKTRPDRTTETLTRQDKTTDKTTETVCPYLKTPP